MKLHLLALLLVCASNISLATDLWLPVKDVSLMVEPGSILDFSSLLSARKPIVNRVVVNPEGHFSVQDKKGQSQRFLMATLVIGDATGSFPDHAMADLYVKQLRMHGYNMVRLHFVELTLMSQRKDDFDFNPEQLDRFYYLLSALKTDGIYYMLDGLTSGNGGYGNVNERWIDKQHLALRVYYDQDAQSHWKILIKKMLASTNPYTRQSTLADPALAGLIMVNEGGLAFVTRKGVPEQMCPLFADWLKKKYQNVAGVDSAWKGELKSGESLTAKTVHFPKPDAWTSRRMADTQEFFIDIEKITADWMTEYLRQLGYKGLVTAYDNWISPAAHISRAQFEWVDLHNYYFEPTKFVAPGSVMRQDSMLAGGGKYIAELAAGRHIGKAFTVTEYGQVFWNKYRRESALAAPAYASFQGWDLISQHAGAIVLSYAEPGGRKDRIFPFMIGPDPIARASETLAALLFLRGDVSQAKSMLGIKLLPNFVFQENALLSKIPLDISRLSLITGIGLDWMGGMEASGKYVAQMAPGNSNLLLVRKNNKPHITTPQSLVSKVDALAQEYAGSLGPKIGKSSVVVDDRFNARVSSIRAAGLLTQGNLTNTANGLYQTDTGQVVLDSERKLLTVITPNTEAMVFDNPEPITLNVLKLEQADGPALISVSSMDGQPVASSKRMLMVLATDARNSDMRFSDASETTLLDLGKGPVLIRTVSVKLKLRNQFASQLKVYSSTLGGKRSDAIKVSHESGSISFVLDTAKLSHGPTTYFEVLIQD